MCAPHRQPSRPKQSRDRLQHACGTRLSHLDDADDTTQRSAMPRRCSTERDGRGGRCPSSTPTSVRAASFSLHHRHHEQLIFDVAVCGEYVHPWPLLRHLYAARLDQVRAGAASSRRSRRSRQQRRLQLCGSRRACCGRSRCAFELRVLELRGEGCRTEGTCSAGTRAEVLAGTALSARTLALPDTSLP